MTVPLVSGLATRTTIWTEPEAPAARLPMDQVTVPPESAPETVAETKVVLVGTVSAMTTPVAPLLPLFEYVSVYVIVDPAATGSGESVAETVSTGAEVTVVVMLAPLTAV